MTFPPSTRELLMASAKKEFLLCGFEGTSLRTICRNADLTTGAFYNHFSQKEDLFDALVKPTADRFTELLEAIMAEAAAAPELFIEKELAAVLYAAQHRDEFRLLFECSHGTKYEGFRSHLINDVFCPGFQSVFVRRTGKTASPSLVKTLLHMKSGEYAELIYGSYSVEELRKLLTQITAFSEAGFRQLLELQEKEI